MVSIFNKSLKDIREGDLISLIEQKVSERQDIEYKVISYDRGDEGKREMLRDISSMANAYGGMVLIGIREEGDSGLPIALEGIDNAEEERDRIIKSCLVNIEPRIPNIEIESIPLSNGKNVCVINIPYSHRGPHLVVFKGLNQFWARHDRHKSPMSWEEIKERFLHSLNLIQDVKNYYDNRKSVILSDIAHNPYYVIAALPLYSNGDFIDIHDERIRTLLRDPPNQREGGWGFNFGLPYETSIFPEPSLDGLRIWNKTNKSLELFRNGYFEARININNYSSIRVDEPEIGKDAQPHVILKSTPLVELCVNYFRELKVIMERYGMGDSQFITNCALYNIKGFGLQELDSGASDPRGYKRKYWNKGYLEIPLKEISLKDDPDYNAKILCDHLWQAFSYEYAPCFENNKFILKTNL
ncbi:MAG: ATP-binding protein [Candidatus Margulisiibacteriota bacterium]